MNHLSSLRTRPLFFVEDVAVPFLSDMDYHHGAKSLRLKEGAAITLSDGIGNWVEARFASTPELVSEPTFIAPDISTTVCFTPVKSVRPEFVVQKLTELGVSTIVPLVTQRSIVRWNEDKTKKNNVKFRLAAREAAMQSKRLHLPVIEPVATLVDSVSENSVLADPAGRQIGVSDRHICIGPEGGFSDEEKNSAELVALPGNILRAETAAITAAAIIKQLQGANNF